MSLTVLSGSTFLLADDHGDVGAVPEGLYRHDVRHLSLWRLTIDGERPKLLSHGSTAHYEAACFGQRADTGHGAPTVALRRRFVVSDSSLVEQLEVSNSALVPQAVTVRYGFDCDFLDLFEVKSYAFSRRDQIFARRVAPLQIERDYDAETTSFAFRVASEEYRAATRIGFSEPGVAGDREIYFELKIAPRSSYALEVEISLSDSHDAAPVGAGRHERERRDVRARLAAWTAATPALSTPDRRLRAVYRQSLADLAALAMESGNGDSDDIRLPAAGLPWLMALFGRHTLLVAFQTLPFGPRLATETLRTLARLQAVADDPERDAEPGKILHELRVGKVAARTPSFPYYGALDSTPLFLMLIAELWRWTGDVTLMRELEGPARSALGWLETHGDLDGDGYLEYHRRSSRGLESQSWKDSWNAVLVADGVPARSPIAPCEVQGYAYAARLGIALVARAAWGDEALAGRLEADAATLQTRFDRDFWFDTRPGGHFALALDRDKRQVDTLTSNIGHLLWTGIVKPERIEATARALGSDQLASGWGIRTVGTRAVGYNPIEYHNGTVWPHDTAIACHGLARAGRHAQALGLYDGLLDLAERFGWRLPEVVAGFSRQTTTFPVVYPQACSPQAWAAGAPLHALRAVLGLEPDVEARQLRLRPGGAAPGLTLELRGLEAFGRAWDLSVADGQGAVVPAAG